MRRVVLAVIAVAAGCHGDGPTVDAGPVEPHALVACDATWTANGFTACEAACMNAARALDAKGPACQAHTTIGRIDCSKTFVFQALTGCCATQPPQVLFGECD